eukprot:5554583-Pyramimonas_sp.AAC.1
MSAASGPLGTLGTPEKITHPGEDVPLDPARSENPQEFPVLRMPHIHVKLENQAFLLFGGLWVWNGLSLAGGWSSLWL